MEFRIEIEALTNAYEVKLPDIEAYNKADAAAKKDKKSSSMGYHSLYMGDFMKTYAAKTVDEVIALITPALKNLPQTAYDEAFAEAAKM